MCSEFFICDNNERLFFYTKTKNPIIIPFNLKTKKHENTFQLKSNKPLNLLVIPKEQTSSHIIRMLLLNNDLDLDENYLIEYSLLDLTYTSSEIDLTRNCLVKKVSNAQRVKVQYGSYLEPNDLIVEYIIMVKKEGLYLLNLDFIPLKEHTHDLLQKNRISCLISIPTGTYFTDLQVYKELVVVIIDYWEIYMIKLSSGGKLRSIVKKCKTLNHLFDADKDHHKLYENSIYSSGPYNSYLKLRWRRSYVFLNHSYIFMIMLSSSASGNYITIYAISLLEFQNLKPNIEFQKLFLEIKSKEDSSLKKEIEWKGAKKDNFNEFLKFEDSKLLINFEEINIFIDFESSFNLRQKICQGISGDLKKIKSKKHPFMTLKPNENHQRLDEIKEDLLSSQEARRIVQGENKTKGNDEKKQRKKQIQALLSQANKNDDLTEFAHLSSSTNKKEWVLKEMEKQKNKKKNNRNREI